MQNLVLFNEWAEEYGRRRYLEHETIEALCERTQDITENLLTIGANGRVVIYGNTEQFRRLLAHVYAEFRLRNMPVPTEIAKEPCLYAQRAARLWIDLNLPEGPYLLKFGNSKYMRALIERGLLHIGSAKTYDSSSLNSAIRDCETEFTEVWYDVAVELSPGTHDSSGTHSRKLDVIGNVRHTAQCTTDYYIACFGMQYGIRLFDEFSRGSKEPYDACVVITDPMRFIETVRERGAQLLAGWDFAPLPITYRDPHHPDAQERHLDVFFIKHFRYAYQRELRLAWIPSHPHDKLESIVLELGALGDYCRLLVL